MTRFCFAGRDGGELPGTHRGKCSSRQGTAAENRGHGYGLRWAGAGVQLHGQRCEPRPGESGSPPLGELPGRGGGSGADFHGLSQGGQAGACDSEGHGAGGYGNHHVPHSPVRIQTGGTSLGKKAGQVAENCGFGGGAVRPGTDSRVTVLPSYAAALAEAAKAELPILFYENEAGTPFLWPWDRNRVCLCQPGHRAGGRPGAGGGGPGQASRLGNLQSGPPDPAMRNRPFVRSGCGDVCRGRVLRGGARVHILRLLQKYNLKTPEPKADKREEITKSCGFFPFYTRQNLQRSDFTTGGPLVLLRVALDPVGDFRQTADAVLGLAGAGELMVFSRK